MGEGWCGMNFQTPFQERHQDYVLGPNQDSRLVSVAPGAVITGMTLQLDHDAPFALRARAYRVSYDTLDSRTQQGLNTLALRYAGPLRDYRQQSFIPQNLVMPYGGQGGAWRGLGHQIVYPAGGVIQLDLVNTGANALTNLTFYFRGVKLFPWGINPAYTYPPKCRMLPFVYPIGQISTANPYGMIQNLATAETRNVQIFTCQNDADFVLRYAQAGPSFAPFPLEVFIQLLDENQKPFSNDFVHYETLFGPCLGNFNCGGTTIPAIGTGNALPSVFYPEIYVPRNHILYYNISRADSGYAGAETIPSFPINLVGSKVYGQ
jgi:hypothetical protein